MNVILPDKLKALAREIAEAEKNNSIDEYTLESMLSGLSLNELLALDNYIIEILEDCEMKNFDKKENL